MSDAESFLDIVLAAGPVMPVYSPRAGDDSVAVARALSEGGLRAIEITLRDPSALDAIRAVAQAVPTLIVGVGTVLDCTHLTAAREAGARFAVSPGSTDALLAGARDTGLPLLPGVSSASDVMRALAHGYTRLKLFPASAVGGVGLLNALGGPFPQVQFCPTGGLTVANTPEYLALDNVRCVGGSWLTPRDRVEAGDWATLTTLARQAAALRPASHV